MRSISSLKLASLLGVEHRAVSRLLKKHFPDLVANNETVHTSGGRPAASREMSPEQAIAVMMMIGGAEGHPIKRKIAGSLGAMASAFDNLISALSEMDMDPDISDRFVYFAREKTSRRIKIGISKNPHKKIADLNIGNPEILELIHFFKASQGFKTEKMIHNSFRDFLIRGEWFSPEIPAFQIAGPTLQLKFDASC